MAHAAHHAELNAQRADGSTLREHYERALTASAGAKPTPHLAGKLATIAAKLEPPPLPDALAYVWQWYLELRAAQRSGLNGIEPLGYGDVRDWAELTGRTPQPFEVRAVMALDATVRNAMRAVQPKAPPPAVERPSRTRGR